MSTIAIVTHQAFLDPTEGLDIKDQDGHAMLALLKQKEIDGQVVAWDDYTVDWSGFDVALISSTWNYQNKPFEFQQWIHKMGQAKCKLFNAPELVLWNMHKSYLLDLEKQGIRIPETYLILKGEILERDVWSIRFRERKWVMKPAVSASAQGVAIAEDLEVVQAFCHQGDVILQSYLPSISEQGEISLVFIDGSYSHAKVKFPTGSDFRVQQEFGGRLEDYYPSTEELSFALLAIEASADLVRPSVYARVDFCRDSFGHLVLMELELIEPELWLSSSSSAIMHLVDVLVGAK